MPFVKILFRHSRIFCYPYYLLLSIVLLAASCKEDHVMEPDQIIFENTVGVYGISPVIIGDISLRDYYFEYLCA